MDIKTLLMDSKGVERALMRISHEIIEKNKGTDDIVIVGIRRRGKSLAEIIEKNIHTIEDIDLPCASIDISFYRDDLTKEFETPLVKTAELPFNVENKKVILVDDVIYTGRTTRAAIEAIFSLGRPSCIQLAVLIDRGHRELPVRPDYIGKNVPTSRSEFIKVMVPEFDDQMGVYICNK